MFETAVVVLFAMTCITAIFSVALVILLNRQYRKDGQVLDEMHEALSDGTFDDSSNAEIVDFVVNQLAATGRHLPEDVDFDDEPELKVDYVRIGDSIALRIGNQLFERREP